MIDSDREKINKILNEFNFKNLMNHCAENKFQYDPNSIQDIDQVINNENSSKNSSLQNDMSFDVYKVREDFPILNRTINNKPLIWFDNGATSQKPKAVINAINNYYSNVNSNVHRGVHTLSQEASDLFDQARNEVSDFINASSSEEIIFTKGATEGFNLIAETIGKQIVQEGDDILITRLEHHSNILPWRRLAQEKNANLKIIPIDKNGDIILDAYSNMLSSKTKIVSLGHVANAIGALLPVEEMVQQAKSFGAITVIDGAQSIPHMKIDVQKLECDFFVFSGHKMFAPTGTGVVFAKKDSLNNVPYQVGGGMIHNVTYENVDYAPSPYLYEAGTANLADIEGLRSAIIYLKSLDMTSIEKYEHQLVQYAYSEMKMLNNIKFIGTPTNRVGVLSFIVKNKDNDEVGKILDQDGIAVRTGHHCAQPVMEFFGIKGTVRASFAFYNTYDEIDKMVAVLKKLV